MGRFKRFLPVHRDRDGDRVARDRGRAAVRRLLGEGRDPRVGVHRRRLRGLGARAARGDLHRALHDAPHPARLLRQRALPRRLARRGRDAVPAVSRWLRRRHGRHRHVVDPADMPEALGYDPDFLPTVDFTETAARAAPPRARPARVPGDHADPDPRARDALDLRRPDQPPDQGTATSSTSCSSPSSRASTQPEPDSFVEGLSLEGIAVVFALIGIGIGLLLYRRGPAQRRERIRSSTTPGTSRRCSGTPTTSTTAWPPSSADRDGPTAEFLDEDVDQKVIDGGVNGMAQLVRDARATGCATCRTGSSGGTRSASSSAPSRSSSSCSSTWAADRDRLPDPPRHHRDARDRRGRRADAPEQPARR